MGTHLVEMHRILGLVICLIVAASQEVDIVPSPGWSNPLNALSVSEADPPIFASEPEPFILESENAAVDAEADAVLREADAGRSHVCGGFFGGGSELFDHVRGPAHVFHPTGAGVIVRGADHDVRGGHAGERGQLNPLTSRRPAGLSGGS